MKHTISVITLTCLSSFSVMHTAIAAEKQNSKKYNILFIIADDQKWNTIGALGNPEVKTPNLNKLSENAMIFRNAYCFGGNCGAVSIPSRNQLITGRNWFAFERDLAEKVKQNPNFKRPIWFANEDWDNLPKTFKKAGYETFYREKSGSANLHKIRTQFDYYKDIHMVNNLRTGRSARTIVDDAIQYIEQERDKDKPFIMYLGLPCPHDPRWSLREFYDLYDENNISLPKNFLPNHYWDIGSMTIRDEILAQFPRTPEAIKKHLHDYYALISAMDYDLGRLFACIEEQDLFKNTIIVYTSDQGIAIGDHGLMGKQNLYEGTMKVPLFITGPGITKGESDAFVYLHDIFPTLCDMVNIPVPNDLDGISFKENIYSPSKAGKRKNIILAYSSAKRNQRTIRVGNWKLMWFPEIDKFSLYDLQNDPDEIDNLAYEAKYRKKVQSLFQKLKKELEKFGDPYKLEKDNSINPVFTIPHIPKDPTGGIAPGPNIAEPPVIHTEGYPLYFDN